MSDSSPWSTAGARSALIVNIIGGLIVGYAIGFVPIMMEFNQYLGDCGRYSASDTCGALTDANCVWATTTATTNASTSTTSWCAFPDHATVNCSLYTDQQSCKWGQEDNCFWEYHKGTCSHIVGWSANEQGMIAGAQILGAMASSASAGPLTNKFGRRWSIALCAMACLVSCFCFSLGWALHENYGLLITAEVLIGLSSGWLSVICPMYCGEMAASLEEAIGVFFQVAVTLGILSASVLGLLLDPRTDTTGGYLHLQQRLQYVLALQWGIALCILPVAYFMPESTMWLLSSKRNVDEEKKDLLVVNTTTTAKEESGGAKTNLSLFRMELLLPLGVGIALASAQQLTGINAVMIYGPQLVGALGFKPLVGNFYIMTWNFLSCLMSIPLVRKFSARQLYIGSTGIATVACLMTGVFVYPGVLEAGSPAQQMLSGLGIALFIAAFECGIGPCFYVLAQDIFPAEVRASGASYTVWVQFVFNVAINWGFPVAMTGFSGGPSGDQNQGMAICFLLFASFGFITTAFMALKMPRSNNELKKAEAMNGEDDE